MAAQLKLEHVWKSYRHSTSEKFLVLEDITLTIEAGERVALLGLSGCGKTTLLRVMSSLEKIEQGSVSLKEASGQEMRTAFVFQDFRLLPWRTVLRNVMLPFEVQKGTRKKNNEQSARRLLAHLGLKGHEHIYPGQLSAGMQQRVSLARGIVHLPSIVFFDEPFNALDEVSRYTAIDVMLSALDGNTTAVLVTHSPTEAALFCRRVIILTQRPARIAYDLRFAATTSAQQRSSEILAKSLSVMRNVL